MSLEQAIERNTAALEQLIGILTTPRVLVTPGVVALDIDAPAEEISMPDPAPSKKAKAKKEEPKPEPVVEEPAHVEVQAPTYDETAKALIAVGAKFGRDKVMDILAPFDSARNLKQVDPSDYAAVIAACELALS